MVSLAGIVQIWNVQIWIIRHELCIICAFSNSDINYFLTYHFYYQNVFNKNFSTQIFLPKNVLPKYYFCTKSIDTLLKITAIDLTTRGPMYTCLTVNSFDFKEKIYCCIFQSHCDTLIFFYKQLALEASKRKVVLKQNIFQNNFAKR